MIGCSTAFFAVRIRIGFRSLMFGLSSCYNQKRIENMISYLIVLVHLVFSHCHSLWLTTFRFVFFRVPASHALVHVWCRIIAVEASVSFVTAALCSAKGTILHRRPSDSGTNKLRFHMCDIRVCYPRFRLLPISMNVFITNCRYQELLYQSIEMHFRVPFRLMTTFSNSPNVVTVEPFPSHGKSEIN